MTFVEVDPKSVYFKGKKYAKYKLIDSVDSFMNSGITCAKITYSAGEYKNTRTAYSAFYSCIRNSSKYAGKIEVFTRENKLYILNKELMEEEEEEEKNDT